MSHDNITSLMVALIGALPWAVGLWLARKRRLEKAARERKHKPRRHVALTSKAGSENLDDEYIQSRSGHSSGDGND